MPMKLQMLKPRLATSTASRIPTMQPGSWRTEGQTSTARGYGYKWQQARERFLRSHPLCCYCERGGKVTAASVVDHRTPHRGNQSLFWDESNWQALCASCHSSAKAAEESADGSR